MNNRLIIIFLATGATLATPVTLPAQPDLEHTYTISASICELEKSGDKYFSMDVAAKQCRIYNMDHTLYRTIALAVPPDHYAYNIQHVSEHTFNQDDLIEFVYIYSKYNPTATSYYYTYETRVINENGQEILKIPGAGHTEIVETLDDGRKFLVYVYDFSQVPATTQTLVYSLPEQTSPLKSGIVRNQRRLGNPWPNPSGGMVNIPVKLPPGAPEGELILYNIHGQEVMRRHVKGEEELLILQEGTLLPGTYVYKLKQRKEYSEGKRITIR
jgi:hypothetical protein